ncbi:uncharacterized protein LOC126896598 [Daktulosphaira vitifoliae]|uniref:uncharacterized protein LOC126896598 n=1 Tax=Daktulosphaira vitifoliae TaxID=58002 RepID=UPI0021AAE7E5|nr:uncharacterized protein LOC126896598 [Daktulosphaira vitifoliae]
MYFNKNTYPDNMLDLFSKSVQSPKILMPFLLANNKSKNVYVFFAEDEIHSQLINVTPKSFFIALWKTKAPQMSNIRKLLRHFWTNEYGCNKLGRPYLLDQWINNSFQSDNDLFSFKVKTSNMHGCHLKCFGNEHPPDSIVHNDGYQRSIEGAGIKVLEIVAKHMNFTPFIILTTNKSNEPFNWFNSAEMLDNITSTLQNDDVDLAFGWFTYAYNNNNNIELARTTSIDCFGWAIPYRAGPMPPLWTNYVYEFDRISWSFIAMIFILVSGILHFFKELKKLKYNSSVFFYVFHTSIDQPLRLHSIWCSTRLFIIHWLWYCMIISVAYKASLGSFMTVPLLGIEFTEMDQILESNLLMMASPQSLRIINATMATSMISRKFMKRLKKLPLTNFSEVIDRMVLERDIAVFEVKRLIYYYSTPQAKLLKVKVPIRFLPGCLLRAHTTQFMFNRGSYLIESIDDVLSRLFETGIIDHWIVHLGSNKVLPLEKIKGIVLQFDQLKEAFLFLVCGYIFAFVVFFVELWWSKLSQKSVIKICLPYSASEMSNRSLHPFTH